MPQEVCYQVKLLETTIYTYFAPVTNLAAATKQFRCCNQTILLLQAGTFAAAIKQFCCCNQKILLLHLDNFAAAAK